MRNFGTILLGNPAQEVTDRVTQIAILEKQYKIVDWIDDMKSNQLGQLHAIYNVSSELYAISTLSEAILSQVAAIGNSAIDMHERINGEHATYHLKAAELRAQIAALVDEIKAIVARATNYQGDSDGLAGVKKDQAEINSKRSKLITIIQDNEDTINDAIEYDAKTEQAPAVSMVQRLNKTDYNDIDQTANIDRTTDDESEHQHVDNDDHHVNYPGEDMGDNTEPEFHRLGKDDVEPESTPTENQNG